MDSADFVRQQIVDVSWAEIGNSNEFIFLLEFSHQIMGCVFSRAVWEKESWG